MSKKNKNKRSLQKVSSSTLDAKPINPTTVGRYSKVQHFSGPLPHPDTLAGYDQIVPGAADRIIQKFEQQTEHRIEMERIVINSGTKKESLGLIFGFVIAMTTIIGGIVTALLGKEFLGGGLSFAGLAILVGAFLFTRPKQSKKNEQTD